MDVTPPPRELHIPAGRWRTMEGRMPDELLVIQPVGSLLPIGDAEWVGVHGWREEPGAIARKTWTVHVHRSALPDGAPPPRRTYMGDHPGHWNDVPGGHTDDCCGGDERDTADRLPGDGLDPRNLEDEPPGPSVRTI